MEKYKIYPFDVVLIEGSLGLALNILALIPASFIPCINETGVCSPINGMKVKSYFDVDLMKYSLKQFKFWRFMLLVYFGDIILYGFSVWTNYYFSPTHLNIAEGISTVLIWLFSIAFLNIGNDYRKSWKPIIGNLLIIIGTLIYNEIFVFNVFELNRFTKFEISSRGEDELQSMILERSNSVGRKSKIELSNTNNEHAVNEI